MPQLTDAKADAAALTKCPITAHGYKGLDLVRDGVLRGFDVYHARPGSGARESLGGNAWAVAGNGAWHHTYSGGGGGVATYGNLWCRDHPWTRGWFRC